MTEGVTYGTAQQLAMLLGSIGEMVASEPGQSWTDQQVRSNATTLRDLLSDRLGEQEGGG